MARKGNIPLTAAVILCGVSLVAMAVALAVSSGSPESATFTPPAFDANAVQGTPSVPEGLGWNEVDAQSAVW